jgi:hypothetical protein
MATSAFFTFDPMRIDAEELIEPIIKSIGGEHEELLQLINNEDSFPSLIEGENARFDQATMLFISSLDWKEGRGIPEQLCKSNIREKIGRFPTSDGNSIKYLIQNTSSDNDINRLHELLFKLMDGLSEKNLGHSGFQEGVGGMELMGWINHKEVTELIKTIKKGEWAISADEIFDGGVQEIIRHLMMLLLTAERRSCGILMRRHI